MPDNEMFKLIVQGGSFAMMVLFFVWFLFKGEPRYRELIIKIEENHAATIKNQNETHRLAVEKLSVEHKEAVESLLRSHESLVKSLAKECREERAEWMGVVIKEGELNRTSRHDIANALQRILSEKYNSDRDQDRNRGSKSPNSQTGGS